MRPTVTIIAPSSPFAPERFEAGLARLTQLDLTVRAPETIRRRNGFLAGTDDERFEAFQAAWLDESVDVLMAARGGYGAHRILPQVETLPPSPNPKRVVGFSDVTALHAWLFRRGVPSIHGPVVTQLGDLGDADLDRLEQVLTQPWPGQTYDADGPVIRGGQARGHLWGGCLSVVTPMLGTPFAPNLDGLILLLEDVGEAPYRLDRLLTHLRLSGAVDRLAGVALGDFVGAPEAREGYPDGAAVLAERLGDLGVPVVAGFPFGHGRRNHAVPLGVPALLDADARRLVIEGEP